jgi:hypothetical protein
VRWTGFNWFRIGPNEHGTESSGTTKFGEFVHQLGDFQFFKEDSAPWGWSEWVSEWASQSVSYCVQLTQLSLWAFFSSLMSSSLPQRYNSPLLLLCLHYARLLPLVFKTNSLRFQFAVWNCELLFISHCLRYYTTKRKRWGSGRFPLIHIPFETGFAVRI